MSISFHIELRNCQNSQRCVPLRKTDEYSKIRCVEFHELAIGREDERQFHRVLPLLPNEPTSDLFCSWNFLHGYCVIVRKKYQIPKVVLSSISVMNRPDNAWSREAHYIWCRQYHGPIVTYEIGTRATNKSHISSQFHKFTKTFIMQRECDFQQK